MAKIAHAMWIHGNSLQIQDESAFYNIVPFGSHMHLHGNDGKATWVHFAIPTPVIVDDKRLRLGSVMFVANTESIDAILQDVHVWDGDKPVQKFNGVNLSGNIGFKRYNIKKHPSVQWGIDISIYVVFGKDPLAHKVNFITAGCDFIP